jgi:SAM-dependent methyltransferase
MTVFAEYARFYDTLYQKKNYGLECDYLEQVFALSGKPVHTILDLGCGTGGHALELSRRGFQVTGVDQSKEMLSQARKKSISLPRQNRPVFHQSDIRSLQIDQKFDVVVSMFAVMCYMTTNQDLKAAISTARNHLNPDGLFFFDAWFGPAVLSQKPSDRYRIFETDSGKVIRFVTPIMDVQNQTVAVNYKILNIVDRQINSEINETHIMRYLFCQELNLLFGQTNFCVLQFSPFMKLNHPLTEDEWNFSVIARAC